MARPEFYLDDETADRAVEFFERWLRHQKGEFAGQPLKLDDWQRDEIIRPLFGWKRADGTRKYRTTYVEIPRKNGKTTIAAGVGLYLLFADGEQGAEVYSAAADRDQAAIAFDLAKSMVQTEPALQKRAQVYRRSIVVPATGSSYKVLSADARSKHGFNAHGIIFDEVHAQPNRELYDVLHTSTGARRQPIEFLITTAGIYDPESIAWQLHEYAEKVRDGVIDDPTFLPVIYSAPISADYRDPAVMIATNPGVGKSVKLDYLIAQAKRAEAEPSYENTFRRLHTNQWTQQVTRWLRVEDWDANAGAVNEAELIGQPCYTGIDLASTGDIAAMVHVFPVGDEYAVLPRFFVPKDNIVKRAHRDRVPYDAWERDGWLVATPGNTTDYGFIRKQLLEDAEKFQVIEVPYDPWNANDFATFMAGQHGFKMVRFRQGYAEMNEPSKKLEKLLLSRKIRHGNNPVLRWMSNNVSITHDSSGNIKPDKEHSTERIDGIVALIMGIGRASFHDSTRRLAWLL